jgi:putative endonuclease
MGRRERGTNAENLALGFLTHHKLKLVTRNYRCRWGEIDLIMQDGCELVFVEVRFRESSEFGGAAASVEYRKKQKLARTAWHYLSQIKQDLDCPSRIDVVALDNAGQQIRWIKNAFECAF